MSAYRLLTRDDSGNLVLPDQIPDNPEQLLQMMNEAINDARTGYGVGAPTFDHGVRIFNLMKAHFDLHTLRELSAAHAGLSLATRKLKNATWLLAVVTVALALVELITGLRGNG